MSANEAVIAFEGHGEVTVPVGTSILQAAQRGHVPQGSACGGVCAVLDVPRLREEARAPLGARDEEKTCSTRPSTARHPRASGCQAKVERPDASWSSSAREPRGDYNEHPDERAKR